MRHLLSIIWFGLLAQGAWGQGLIALEDGWQAAHGQLVSPLAFPEDAPAYRLPERTPPERRKRARPPAVSTLRLRIELPSDTRFWGLFVPPVFSSYNLFIDGKRVGERGIPSLTAGTCHPRVAPGYYFFESTAGGTEILLQVADFHFGGDRLLRPPLLGRAEAVQIHALLHNGLEAFLIVLLTLAGALFFLFPEHRRALESRLMAGSLISLAIRTGVTGQRLLSQALPGLGFEPVMDLAFVTTSLAAMFYMGSMAVRYRDRVDPGLTLGVLGINLLGIVSVLALPTRALSFGAGFFESGIGLALLWSFLLPFGLWIRDRHIDLAFWLTLFPVPVTAAVDFLGYLGLHRLDSLMPLGLSLFILGQMVYLAIANALQEKRELDILIELGETVTKHQEYVSQFQHHLRTPIHSILSAIERNQLSGNRSEAEEAIARTLTELNREIEALLHNKF